MPKNNSKLTTVLLIIILALGIYLVFFKHKAEAPIENTDTSSKMPAIENRDQIQTTGKATINDLIGFSIWPGSKVHGVVSYRGTIQGAYFFEANIRINILDMNKNVLKASNAHSTTEWAGSGPVEFEGNIDFSELPTGSAYFEIQNDNASGGPQNDKNILIPIVIEATQTTGTKTYANHGITLEFPANFTPHEEDAEGGPYTIVTLPNQGGQLRYIRDYSFWQTYEGSSYVSNGTEKIGTTTFSKYTFSNQATPPSNEEFYFFKQGNVGYLFPANATTKELLKTFKFVGWN